MTFWVGNAKQVERLEGAEGKPKGLLKGSGASWNWDWLVQGEDPGQARSGTLEPCFAIRATDPIKDRAEAGPAFLPGKVSERRTWRQQTGAWSSFLGLFRLVPHKP